MKEFYIYKLYMYLFELLRGLIIIILATFILMVLPVIITSATNITIAFSIFVMAGLSTQLYMGEIKEKVGEYITQKVIESYCNKRGYSYLYDVKIKNDSGKISKIDHLIITRRGIAVVETKFHTGKIYVLEDSENWTYLEEDDKNESHKKHKNYFHNPITENNKHLELLKKIVDKDVEYYNIVLFIDKVKFTKYIVTSKFTKVGYTYELNDILEKFDSLSETKISSVEACKIYNKIKDTYMKDKVSSKKHVNKMQESKA